jgi:hypothetical protein
VEEGTIAGSPAAGTTAVSAAAAGWVMAGAMTLFWRVGSAGGGACAWTETGAAGPTGARDEYATAEGAGTLIEATAGAAGEMTGTPTAPFGCTTAVSPTAAMARLFVLLTDVLLLVVVLN